MDDKTGMLLVIEFNGLVPTLLIFHTFLFFGIHGCLDRVHLEVSSSERVSGR